MKVKPAARIAFQGERGAFSEEAALKLLGPEIMLVPRGTFDATFSAIQDGSADYVLAPMENSLAGSVHRSFDLLVESGLHIIGEVVIPIVHNLIGVPGAKFAELTSVESHPVALAQCEQFFIANPQLKRIVTEDTAGSVREIMRAGDATTRGHRQRARRGIVRRRDFAGAPGRRPRKLHAIFSAGGVQLKYPADADKISLVFQLPHAAGALQQALAPFARRNLNLMKIESRPMRGRPWEYRFYLDLQASAGSAATIAALEQLKDFAVDLHVLGSYKSAETPASSSVKKEIHTAGGA